MNGAHNDEFLDDVAMLAVGALTQEEAAPVLAHLEQCEICGAEYRSMRSVTAVLPLAAGEPATSPSPLLKRRIMSAVRPAASAKRAAPVLAYAFAAACLAIAAVFGGLYASVLSGVNAQRTMLADMMSPSSQRYPVHHGEVLRHGDRLYIAMHNMPPPPPGKVYQAWTLPAGSKQVQPSVTFMPSSGSVLLKLPVNGSSIAAVAVSVEPQGGSKQPTSTPMFIRPLRG